MVYQGILSSHLLTFFCLLYAMPYALCAMLSHSAFRIPNSAFLKDP